MVQEKKSNGRKMTAMTRFKLMEKSKKIKLIFLIFILISSLSISIAFLIVINSLNQVIERVKIPNGYFKANLEPVNASLEIPFSVENQGFYAINEFEISISIRVSYFNGTNEDKTENNVFKKTKDYGIIKPGQYYENKFEDNGENFDLIALTDFINNVNITKGYDILVDIEIKGKYFYSGIPFNIAYYNMNLEDLSCPTCNK